MARNEEEEAQGPGITERVTGTVKRAVGAVGRAARGAMGRPEAGTDELFQALHADHEEVAQLFEKLLATREEARAHELWTRVSVALLTHARAEQEIVYERFANIDELTEDADHSLEEHEQIEDLLLEANDLKPGTPEFVTKVRQLDETVRHHVDDEEGDLLPKAMEFLSDEERERLVARFQERKDLIEPKINVELTGHGAGTERPKRPARTQKSQKQQPQQKTGGRGATDLDARTMKELQEMARKKGIEGRSRMKKKDLIAALTRT